MARAEVEMGYTDREVTAGLAKLEGRFGKFGKTISGAFGANFGAKLSGIGSALIGAGVLQRFHTMTEHYDTLNKLAVRFDTSAESMQRLEMMARMADMPVEGLVTSTTKLIRNLEEAESDPKIAKALQKLRISAADLRKAGPEDQIIMLAKAFTEARARGQGFAEIFDLMGRSAGDMIPLLAQGAEQLERFKDRAVLSHDDVQTLAEFNDQLKSASITAGAFTARLTTGLADFLAVASAAASNMLWNQGTTFAQDINDALDAAAAVKVQAAEEADARDKAAKAARGIAEQARQEAKAKADAAAAEKEAAKAAEKQAREKTAAEDFAAELQVLEARIHGRNKLADQMEREIAIRKEARQLQQSLGIPEEEAMGMAKKHADMKDQLEKKQSGKIMGYKKPAQAPYAGLDWLYGHNRVKGGRPMTYEWKFPALDAMQKRKGTDVRPPGAEPANKAGAKVDSMDTVVTLLNRIAEGTESITAY